MVNCSEWKSTTFEYSGHISTMLSVEKKQFFHWLRGVAR